MFREAVSFGSSFLRGSFGAFGGRLLLGRCLLLGRSLFACHAITSFSSSWFSFSALFAWF